MLVPVRIPQAGTAAEASLVEWTIQVGQRVDADQVIGTAETDKVTLEIVAPCAGVVAEILIQPGEELPISDPVATIDAGDQGSGDAAEIAAASPVAEVPAAVVTEPTSQDATRIVPLSPVRRRIAENLQWVADHTVRASTTIEVDFEAIARLRAQHGERFRREAGFALTPLAFVARAVCATLPSFPDVQSSIDLERGLLTINTQVHLGLAVAQEQGLRVAVVHNADRMPLIDLARAIRRLVDRVREGSLDVREAQGGTFTITNPGALGSIISSPIMNRGETAILSLDAVEPRAVVVDGAIAIHHRAYLTLAFDHRVVDGAMAIGFLRGVEKYLGSAELEAEAEAW